ncbi:MAG: NADH-quinone oxidoreductase subunit C [Candidatus Altiarchaeota archaeon]
MQEKKLSPEEIVVEFKKKFKEGILEDRIFKRAVGKKKKEFFQIWIKIRKEILREVIKHLMSIEKFPHLAIISGNDLPGKIELIYHFSIYYGEKLKEISINFSLDVPKENLIVPTITDLIPGALITEREKQEMLGIKFENIPDSRRIFLGKKFPEGVYPWRKDSFGAEKYVKKLDSDLRNREMIKKKDG